MSVVVIEILCKQILSFYSLNAMEVAGAEYYIHTRASRNLNE